MDYTPSEKKTSPSVNYITSETWFIIDLCSVFFHPHALLQYC